MDRDDFDGQSLQQAGGAAELDRICPKADDQKEWSLKFRVADKRSLLRSDRRLLQGWVHRL